MHSVRRSFAWIAVALTAAIVLLVYFGFQAASDAASSAEARAARQLDEDLAGASRIGASKVRAVVARTRLDGVTAAPIPVEEVRVGEPAPVSERVRRARGRDDEAAFERIVLETDDADEEVAALRHLARIHWRRGDMVGAVASLERAVAVAGASSGALSLARGALAQYRGEPHKPGGAEALPRAHSWLAASPDRDQLVRVDLDRVAWRLGDDTLAVARLEDVLWTTVPGFDAGRWRLGGDGRPLPAPFPAVVVVPAEAVAGAGTRQYRWTLLPPMLAAGVLACAGAFLWFENRRRERFARRRRAFTTAVTHELKTPIANISLYAETLREHGRDDPAQVPRFAGIILAEAERLRKRVEEVLDVASGRRTLPPGGAFGVSAVVASVVSDYCSRGVSVALEDHGPVHVRGSEALFQRALDGVLDNAMKFGGDGEVRVSVTSDNGHVMVVVDDAGQGVPRGERGRVFEPFVRLADESVAGTGLGLALVKQCVEDCGGTVTMGAGARGGARVEIKLQAADDDASNPSD